MIDGASGPLPSELGLTQKDLGIRSPVQEPPIGDELTRRLREIDESITERHVRGKFKGPIILHGKEQGLKNPNPDYKYYPDDDYNLDPTGQFSVLNDIVRKGVFEADRATGLRRRLAQSHIFAFLGEGNDSLHQANLVMIYPDASLDPYGSGRRNLTVEIYLRIPRGNLQKLVQLVARNRDAVEEFYQIVTDGLDQSTQRYESSQLAFIDLDVLLPAARVKETPHASALRDNTDNPEGIAFVQFTKPHGQVDIA